ncbi:MAG: hypothetical protein QXZ13_01200 [Candidatus Diapherotrites archaeon]
MRKFKFFIAITLAFTILFFPTVFSAITCGDTNHVCVVNGTNTTSMKFVDGNTY